MRNYLQETERLKQVQTLVTNNWPRLGINKIREVVRLVYEISKRENIAPDKLFSFDLLPSFAELKKYLLKRRYPTAFKKNSDFRPYLPGFKLGSSLNDFLRIEKNNFSPRRIWVEEKVEDTTLLESFSKRFPSAMVSKLPEMKCFPGDYRKGSIQDYNRRSENIFIISEKRDFFKPCPCTGKALPCGYTIFNLSFGCIYECTYCYLQEYSNTPGLIFPSNVDHFLEKFFAFRDRSSTRLWQRGPRLRIGTGEFSDSLMLDELTGYSIPIVEFFRGRDDVIFEFKTKSSNIENLLNLEGRENIVVGWSLNPQNIIDENEYYTASLNERIESAGRILEAGYRVAFHFDPVFFYQGWKPDYRNVIERIQDEIEPDKIAWISLGTLRFKPGLKKIIEARFPNNKILDAEMVLGFDDKLRYPDPVRYRVYRSLLDTMTRFYGKVPIYLCMEDKIMWKALNLPFPF